MNFLARVLKHWRQVMSGESEFEAGAEETDNPSEPYPAELLQAEGDSLLPAGAADRLFTLKAAVKTGMLGGPDDGRARYPIERFIQAPDNPDPAAGRCLRDSVPWDDHRRPYPAGPTSTECPGIVGPIDRAE